MSDHASATFNLGITKAMKMFDVSFESIRRPEKNEGEEMDTERRTERCGGL